MQTPKSQDESLPLFKSSLLEKIKLPLKEMVGGEFKETEFCMEFSSFYTQAYWDSIGCYVFL